MTYHTAHPQNSPYKPLQGLAVPDKRVIATNIAG